MKNMDDDTCNAKRLEFTLTPHMGMEQTQHDQHHHFNHSLSCTVSTSFYENNVFHSYVMPLHSSDASLCIMDNPSRSQHSQGNVV